MVMFCLKKALTESGIENINLPASVNRDDLPTVCAQLGLILYGYYSSREECESEERFLEYIENLGSIPQQSPVIAIYATGEVMGHAEYFDSYSQVPEDKKRGMMICGI
jgi:hypothetical protein